MMVAARQTSSICQRIFPKGPRPGAFSGWIETLLLVPLALGAVSPAAAQQVHADGVRDDEIVVLGTGLPLPPGTPAYGSVIIDRARLRDEASGRVENALKDVAGFQQFRRSDSRSANPSAQGVTLRALGGNASSRTLVLLDGVPVADPFFGYIPFTALVGDRLGGIRVTRGGGSGAFGAGAVAGTIELVSAGRRGLPLLSGEGSYGSDHAASVSATVSPDLGGGFATLSGRFERGDGFDTTPPGQRVAASVPARYRAWSIGLRSVARLDAQTDLQFHAASFAADRTLRFRGADSRSEGEDASIRLVHRGRWQIDALAYLQARNFTNKVISATSFRLTLDQRDTPSTGIGGKIELRPPVGAAHVLRIGLDTRGAHGELFEDAYSGVTGLVTARRTAGGRTGTTGAFAEDDWSIGRLVLTGGIRADRWMINDGFFRERTAAGAAASEQRFADRNGIALTGRTGALLRARDTVSLRAAGYTGFRVPTLNELYRPFVVFPVTTQANDRLDLEHLKGIEAGIDLTPGRDITVGITAFYNRLDDAIANVTIGPYLRQRRNVDAIVARGIELTAHARRGVWSLGGSYAFSDSRVMASGSSAALDGFAPAQSPRHAASATLGWQSVRGPVLSATLRYVGAQFEDDLATDTLPAALTVDAVARLPITHEIALIARAENLFDETVVTRNAGGSMDVGTPRTLWIGLRLR